MRSCICLFYICSFVAPARGQVADALYADRANLASARRAAGMWSAELARDATQFDAAWKLARVDYWLGGHVPEGERRALYEEGVAAAQKAIRSKPDRPEGHFWAAANMGALAESFGLRQGLKYRKTIKDELETVLRIDPSYEQGSADRALGRWYYKVPRLFGGSRSLAEQHLRAALQYNNKSIITYLFLAELFADSGRTADARAALQKVLDLPIDPQWAPEDEEFKARARTMLASLK
jgi:tetratricopeptide (TPR) repeat protein